MNANENIIFNKLNYLFNNNIDQLNKNRSYTNKQLLLSSKYNILNAKDLKAIKNENNELLMIISSILCNKYKTTDFDKLMTLITPEDKNILFSIYSSMKLSIILFRQFGQNQRDLKINDIHLTNKEIDVITSIYNQYSIDFLNDIDNYANFDLSENAYFDCNVNSIENPNRLIGRFNGSQYVHPINNQVMATRPYDQLKQYKKFVKTNSELNTDEINNVYITSKDPNGIPQFETIYNIGVNNEVNYTGSTLMILKRLNEHFDFCQDKKDNKYRREHSKMFHGLMLAKYETKDIIETNINVQTWHLPNLFNHDIFKKYPNFFNYPEEVQKINSFLRDLVSIHQDLYENLILLEQIKSLPAGTFISGGTLGAHNDILIK